MKHKIYVGIILMIVSSITTCLGQLMWKLAAVDQSMLKYASGFCLYAIGALIMMVALQFGELSVLHPMLSFGFVVSMFLGYFVLNENITIIKLVGVVLIISGLIFMSFGAGKREEEK